MEEETTFQDLLGFEFFLILLPNFLKKLRLPDKFAKVLDGRELQEVKLREDGRRRRLWDMEVVLDAEGHMYLGHGWEQFARAHGLRLGHFLVISYDSHVVLTVKVFDQSMCRRHYQHDNDASSASTSDSGSTVQGAEGEGEVPPQTGAEEDDGEQVIYKMSNPCDSDGSQKGRCYSSEELSEDSPSVDNSVEPAHLQTVSNNYVISAQCYPTKAQKVKIDALIEKIQPKITVLVVQMKKTNAKRHGTLVIQKDYAREHFPCEDTTVILQLPGKKKHWKCTFHITPSGMPDAGRRNLNLRNFSCDNHVSTGDICLFQPMTNVKHRRFRVTVHLLHKASIAHYPGGRTDIVSNHGSTSATMGGVKEEPPTDGEVYSSEHEQCKVSEDSQGASESLFILADRACLTPAQYLKCLGKVEEIKFKPPFYVSIVSKSMRQFPMLNFVWQYAARYLLQKFAAGHHDGNNSSISLVLQREGKSRSWTTKLNYRHRTLDTTNRMGIYKGWESFAHDNHLREGDLCLFKLMDNEEQLTMMVYIVRR
ncbi:unnamed protein product [Triticum turgidum subsp. durum]|uniref:TF-B3 domain-containing protein n=1 Tax=Triticum turgidum subsp. durum TaxID=4567 RepID=A0A9R0RY88_TRITD|nr:unnamed protein product [Triticum turgidum subsp. durum]